ncbi:MAG: peptide-methionine (S)-S-oxide reductase MsrA [Bacillota bacterium]
MKTETATFAAGCFWGVQSTFQKVPGVISTQVGYTGGRTANPTYRDVCSDATGHAEAIEVVYDPTKVSYQKLLEIFFENHDPTTFDRQGPDVGSQYRSAIFYHTPEQQRLAIAEKDKRNDSGQYVSPIITQIVPAGPFYRAEEYHQRYYEKQGLNWTCHFGNGKKPTVGAH